MHWNLFDRVVPEKPRKLLVADREGCHAFVDWRDGSSHSALLHPADESGEKAGRFQATHWMALEAPGPEPLERPWTAEELEGRVVVSGNPDTGAVAGRWVEAVVAATLDELLASVDHGLGLGLRRLVGEALGRKVSEARDLDDLEYEVVGLRGDSLLLSVTASLPDAPAPAPPGRRAFETASEAEAFLEGVEYASRGAVRGRIDPTDPTAVLLTPSETPAPARGKPSPSAVSRPSD